MEQKPIPIGIDSFEKLITGHYYYADKTWFIHELLERKSEVNLFTRPRRFGKTLNLSMLQYFFEDGRDANTNQKRQALFHGLDIMNDSPEILAHMNSYPVINLSLKSSKQPTLETARYRLYEELWREYDRHSYVLDCLSGSKKEFFQSILDRTAEQDAYSGSLRFLSSVLELYHGKKVIILIDEYDVPLENAYFCGFYSEMAAFIRTLFEMALKTNPHLEFAVITGCLRISKESIFTGLNNLNINSIAGELYGSYFGFTQPEIDDMLAAYQKTDKRDVLKTWYDGYQFCADEVYNPWSALNYIQDLRSNPEALPKPYWANTSSNDIIKALIQKAGLAARQEIEELLQGGVIEKPLREDITYDSIYDSDDTLWNFLFFTGYLKQTSVRLAETQRYVTMTIPNLEVRYIYDTTIRGWFRDEVEKRDLTRLYQAMFAGDSELFQQELAAALRNSISYMDSKEAFYHGFVVGMMGNLKDYLVRSNREAGHGRLDVTIYSLDIRQTPVILELKVSPSFKEMEHYCQKALEQIETMHYDFWLPEEGYSDVRYYGISFFKKQCRIAGKYKKFE